MDAGFFRVRRSAGSWGGWGGGEEARDLFVRPGTGLKLGTWRPVKGGLRDFEGPCGQRAVSSALRPRPVRSCAVASSGIVPPPLRGGGRKMAAGMGQNRTSPAA